MGGVARRAAYIKKERDLDSDLLLVSAGDFFGKAGILERYRSAFLADMMMDMGYDAVAVGEEELAYDMRVLKEKAEAGLPVICANLYSEGERIFPSAVIENVKGRRIGIFALLGESPPLQSEVEVRDVVSEGLQVLNELKTSGCDLIVLLAHMRKERILPLLGLFDGVDMIIRGHAGSESMIATDCTDTIPEAFVDSSIPMLFAGDRGRVIGKTGISFPDQGDPVLFDRSVVFLDGTMDEDRETAVLLKRFMMEEGERAREMHLSKYLSRDEVTGKIRERYLGFNVCRRCHTELSNDFVSSRHFRAFASISAANEEDNPKCLACHTTGYGQFSGYDPKEEKRGGIYLKGVQCEACHGQGTMHSRDGRYVKSARESCRRCHTSFRSPDFDYEEYMKRMGHCYGYRKRETAKED